MKLLGICHEVWISSAVLIDDGKIVAGSAEERFDRRKMSKAFPISAIKYCLQEANCSLEDINCVAVAWNPGIHLKRLNPRFSSVGRWQAEYLYSVPNQLLSLLKEKRVEYVEQRLKLVSGVCRIMYVTHHLAHAANAFFPSPFEEAAILTIDGRGEDDTALFGMGRGNKIEEIQSVVFPHSLGLLYGTFTEFLGFKPDSDEWMVMALASYGTKDNEYYKRLKGIVKLQSNGKFELDLSYFNYYLHDQSHFYTTKFVESFGEPREPDSEITERHQEIAAALQQITEETLAHMLNWLHQKTEMKNIVVSGGSFMNSAFNGKILKKTAFENIFISSCPDDSGTSMGAALYVYNQMLDNTNREEQVHNYYGPLFSNDEIKKILEKYKIKGEYIEEIEKYTARLINNGKIVGWFQGRMEFGQRALGNRSILADPRRPEMKDKVNLAVKYRETFRPFAPSILEERVAEYFDCDVKLRAPFMEKVFKIKEEKQKIIPAVTHVDGTGRLQTVNKKTNERFYRLIDEFCKITGVPVILNTSFNLKGEPIVCTPIDAIRTFYSCGLDVLVLGNYMIMKSK